MVKDSASREPSRPAKPVQEPSARNPRGAAPGPSPRRANTSPYSRTGLFPWGNTYDVPAQREGPWVLSQTPCHLRTVRLPADQAAERSTVRCAACGRVWSVRLNLDKTPPAAAWTA